MEFEGSGAPPAPLTAFCARLKRLQEASGITQAQLCHAANLGSSQMSNILNGKIKKPPSWVITKAVVRACLDYANTTGRPVPPDLDGEEDWRRRYADLELDLDAVPRPEARREPLPGWLLSEVTDPFALEVHRPVESGTPREGLPLLPAYLPREHDAKLEQVIKAAAEGRSGIAVLVGGSSTGKTRACWEALRLLRDQSEPWRLWYPIAPSRPDAALRELPRLSSRTVVWLNEAQFYLGVPGRVGEKVAAELQELLRDPGSGPVLVLATLWPQHWDDLTRRPTAGDPDRHADARALLSGHSIRVPSDLTKAEVEAAAATGDPRLALAATQAKDARVIQFLAGAPELMARYDNATPPVRALLDATIDARRLGMGPAVPRGFLADAAPGYIADADWDELPSDTWLEKALADTGKPAKGIRGPLAPADRQRTAEEDSFRLADYLEQHGRQARRGCFPPEAFWAAAARHASPGDLPALAAAAKDRGLLRDAARLRKQAAGHGSAREAANLVRDLHALGSGSTDRSPGQWAAARVSLDDPGAVADLLAALQAVGAGEEATGLASRAIAQVTLKDPGAVAKLLDVLWRAGASEQVQTLVRRDPAAKVSSDSPYAAVNLAAALERVGAGEQAIALASRAAAQVSLDDPGAVADLLSALQDKDMSEQVEALVGRDPAAHAPLDDPHAVRHLIDVLLTVGAGEQAIALASRAAAQVSLDDPRTVADLLGTLRLVGAGEQVEALIRRDPAAHVSLDNPGAVKSLIVALRAVGAGEQVEALIRRDPAAHVSLDKPYGVADLLAALRKAGAGEQHRILVDRLPAEGQFQLFLEQVDDQTRYQYGRDPDGEPALSWGWQDLE